MALIQGKKALKKVETAQSKASLSSLTSFTVYVIKHEHFLLTFYGQVSYAIFVKTSRSPHCSFYAFICLHVRYILLLIWLCPFKSLFGSLLSHLVRYLTAWSLMKKTGVFYQHEDTWRCNREFLDPIKL